MCVRLVISGIVYSLVLRQELACLQVLPHPPDCAAGSVQRWCHDCPLKGQSHAQPAAQLLEAAEHLYLRYCIWNLPFTVLVVPLVSCPTSLLSCIGSFHNVFCILDACSRKGSREMQSAVKSDVVYHVCKSEKQAFLIRHCPSSTPHSNKSNAIIQLSAESLRYLLKTHSCCHAGTWQPRLPSSVPASTCPIWRTGWAFCRTGAATSERPTATTWRPRQAASTDGTATPSVAPARRTPPPSTSAQPSRSGCASLCCAPSSTSRYKPWTLFTLNILRPIAARHQLLQQDSLTSSTCHYPKKQLAA